MADLISISPFTLQFVLDSLRTAHVGTLDLTSETNRKLLNTRRDKSIVGKPAIRNGDGTAMTVAQIATAANLTVAQVNDLAGRI